MTPPSFNTLFIGKVYHQLDEIPSTNAFAAELLSTQSALEGTLVVAETQTKGRGYSGNTWVSEKGKNLLFSIILKPTFLQARQQFYLNELVTLGLFDALKSKLGNNLKIKWPNDIYYEDEKLAGILIENSLNGNFIQHSIIGIGLNVNQTKFSDGIENAVSLKMISDLSRKGRGELVEPLVHKEKTLRQAQGDPKNGDWDLTALLEKICSEIEVRYLQLKNNQLQTLQQDYMKALYRIEEECWYRKDGKKFKAKIVGLNPEGKLMLATDKGWDAYGFKEVEFVI